MIYERTSVSVEAKTALYCTASPSFFRATNYYMVKDDTLFAPTCTSWDPRWTWSRACCQTETRERRRLSSLRARCVDSSFIWTV